MTLRAVFTHPALKAELQEIGQWYDRRRPELGSGFIEQLNRTIDRIRLFPEGSTRFRGDIRLAPLSTFPYHVVFRVTPSHVEVIALHHQNRDPSWFEGRIG